MSRLQKLSIESILNKRYEKPNKDLLSNTERLYRYININMAKHLDIKILPGRKWGVDLQPAKEKFAKDGMNRISEMLDKMLDECSVQTFYLFRRYLEEKFTNYVPSTPLLSVLKSIDVDMKASYLKDGTSGYFELSHANIYPPSHWSPNKITGCLFTVTEKSLLIALTFDKDIAPTSFFVPLYKEENLSEALMKFQFKKLSRVDGGQVIQEEQDISQNDIDGLKLFFNLLIYVTNPNEEFVAQFNKFSPNNRIAQIEKNEYTTQAYVPMGIDAEFLRLVTTDSFDVRGHWRWQACGPEHSLRRLTFIKPHTRNMSKYIGGV